MSTEKEVRPTSWALRSMQVSSLGLVFISVAITNRARIPAGFQKTDIITLVEQLVRDT